MERIKKRSRDEESSVSMVCVMSRSTHGRLLKCITDFFAIPCETATCIEYLRED